MSVWSCFSQCFRLRPTESHSLLDNTQDIKQLFPETNETHTLLSKSETFESIATASSSSIATSSSSSSSTTPSTLKCKEPNYLFYKNQIPSKPSPGGLIDAIHKNWFGKYRLLEEHHGFIQWLFPVFESRGMSSYSSQLGKKEAFYVRNDLEISVRVIKSYKLMLDFYGMQLVDYETGQIERNPANWKSRYENLNYNGHNYLRISRILMSLGELGFVRYKQPFLDFIGSELKEHNRLSNCKRSYQTFWTMLCNPEAPGYKEKTRETAEDRAESVFFEILKAGGQEWESTKQILDQYGPTASNKSGKHEKSDAKL